MHTYHRTCALISDNFHVGYGVNAQGFAYQDHGWVMNTGSLNVSNFSYFTFGIDFNLSMLPNYTEFTALYDQYKFDRFEVRLIPFSTNATLQSGATGSSNQSLACILHTAYDFDDSGVPTATAEGINQLEERQTYKMVNFFAGDGKGFTYSIYPRVDVAIKDTSAVYTAYSNDPPKWIDCNFPNVLHYGLKGIFQCFSPSASIANYIWFKAEVTAHFKMRDQR